MKLGILKTDDVRAELVGKFGEYPQQFENLLSQVDPSLAFITYEVQHGDFPKDIDEVDAYLITGSKSGVYDDKPWIHELAEFVRKLHAAQKKLIGICFGHQLVAHALGGKTEKSDKGWGVGVHSVTVTQDSPFAKKGDSYKLLVSHQDQVVRIAEGAQVLAGSDFCPFAMCQIGEHVLTFQGHPEFVKDYSAALLDLRRDLYGEELYHKGKESLHEALDQLRVAQWIVDFIKR